MATCGDCIHFDLCEIMYSRISEIENCDYFKDRSRFVELPKVDDTVFEIVKINSLGDYRLQELKVTSRIIDTNGVAFDIDLLGKRFFLTPEEAEQALKEKEKKDNEK